MSWRFRKSKSLFGGLLRLTLGRRGLSSSIGIPGFRVSRSQRGKLRRNISLPGTGLSRTDVVRRKQRRKA